MCKRNADEPCCGTCVFHKREEETCACADITVYVCVNENAEAYGFQTEYCDSCVDYEERQERR